ncbi:hypothetical protein D3C72_258400 [compost metagenome]
MTAVVGFTVAELESRQLFPIFASNSDDDISYFVNFEDTNWNGDIKTYVQMLAAKPELLESAVCFKRCSSATKLNREDCYFPIQSFTFTMKGMRATWETSVKEVKNQVSREQSQAYRAKNIPFLRMYAMGNPEGRIHCPIFNICIDSIELFGSTVNAWVQHHYRFVNGVSVHKENLDPGAILSSTDFTVPTTRAYEGIKDMARTIFLSSTAHDALHKIKRSGDIADYTIEQLPWALRSEANWEEFNTFVMGFGYDHLGDYQTWFDDQKN